MPGRKLQKTRHTNNSQILNQLVSMSNTVPLELRERTNTHEYLMGLAAASDEYHQMKKDESLPASSKQVKAGRQTASPMKKNKLTADLKSDFDDDSLSGDLEDSDGSEGSTTRKLQKIEKKIKSGNLTKKERRLLQNRKSALKCRLKKQD